MSKVSEPSKEAALKQLIAERAYDIWENQGHPQGCHLIHWHEAEQEIRDCVKQASEESAHQALDVPVRQEPPASSSHEDRTHKMGEDRSESLSSVVQSRRFFAYTLVLLD